MAAPPLWAHCRSSSVSSLPFRNFHVVVEQQQILTRSRFPAEVVDAGEVEALFRVVTTTAGQDHRCFALSREQGRQVSELFSMTMTSWLSHIVFPDALQALFPDAAVWSLIWG